jgi:hypothetical protein
MPYTLSISVILGTSRVGYTLAAQLYDTSGADIGSEIQTGFVEIGNGNYLWTYDSFPDDFRGGVKFYRTSDPSFILATTAFNPEEAEYLDMRVSEVGSGSGTGNIDISVGHSDLDINVTNNPAIQSGKNIQITTNVEDLGDNVGIN